ncbi:MAG: hypothetical protein EBR30_04020 [Cytophagia bacterium]|jgi:hypothetical protein|nr:hypothetical protein [Cytophagia bacterium]NBW34181.1 hypothetical protein [Cytophagia bacterium]
MNDRKLFKYLLFLLILPIGLAIFGGDRFRYPCQDPKNWDKEMCQKPLCDVTRTCPEHVFKGQRDPRLGPPNDAITNQPVQQTCAPQGVACGK